MQNIPKVSSSYFKNPQSIAGKMFLGLSAFSGALAFYSYFKSFVAQNEIEWRKSQLRLPVVQLSEGETINPPWNNENINDWLYRRVEVTGRPIHRLCCMVPRREFTVNGYEYVLPLVTKEDDDYSNRYGLIFSMGWIPGHLKHPSYRSKIESTDRRKFLGFVSRLEQLQNNSFTKGNAYHHGRLDYYNADVKDFARSSELLNKKQASVAVIERLHELDIFDERHHQRYACNGQFSEDYPYAKTEAGALQLPKMPWDYKNEARNYSLFCLASLLVGASIF